jgi:hypothetical protein
MNGWETGSAMVKYCICMVSDFFFPNMGGVESHIFEVDWDSLNDFFRQLGFLKLNLGRYGHPFKPIANSCSSRADAFTGGFLSY